VKNAFLLPLLIHLVACQPGRAPVPSVAEVPAAVARSGPSGAEMERHAIFAQAVRDAIMRADLEHAQKEARRLTDLPITLDAVEYAERFHLMEIAAGQVVAATTIVRAAHAFGELTKACATCHARLQGPTWVDVSGTAPGTVDSSWAMPRHAWAMTQMYNGVLYNSERPWQAGAELLANRAAWADELPPRRLPSPRENALATSMRELGLRAQSTSDGSLRADLYGELLASCAGCHERTGGGPMERWHE